MNIEQLYRDYGITYVTSNHKHAREGWVNTPCPFCIGNEGMHLGYNLEGGNFVCWRCGSHSLYDTLEKLLSVPRIKINGILKEYGGVYFTRKEKQKEGKPFKLPPNSAELTKRHIAYLEKRGFDSKKIVKQWGLLATGTESRMDKIDYSRRIVIPYMWDDKIVSFDSRDITDKAQNKYMACSEDRELVRHKNILYGNQSKWISTGIILEGCTDVWRFGDKTCATSGIKYTPRQVRVIAKTFPRVAVVYDAERQAKKQADMLVEELKFRRVEAFRVDLDEGVDPGSMKQDDADHLVRNLLKIIK